MEKEEETNLIDKSIEVVKRLEAANAKQEELLERQEKLMILQKLGGTAEAGFAEKIETEDEKWATNAKLRYAGTGMDPT